MVLYNLQAFANRRGSNVQTCSKHHVASCSYWGSHVLLESSSNVGRKCISRACMGTCGSIKPAVQGSEPPLANHGYQITPRDIQKILNHIKSSYKIIQDRPRSRENALDFFSTSPFLHDTTYCTFRLSTRDAQFSGLADKWHKSPGHGPPGKL